MKIKLNDLSYLTLVWTSVLVLQGCATEGKSIGLGAGIGAGTGALLGGIVDPGQNGLYRTRNVVIGAAFGGMAGMAAGSLLHGNTEEKQKEAFLQGQKSVVNRPLPTSGPEITQSKVEINWIEGHAVGNRWIDGHYERIIKEPPHWEVESK